MDIINYFQEEEELTSLEDWLTTEIVLDMLNISARTLQTMRSKKQIGFSKVGNKCYYKRKDVENWLESRYCPAK